MIFLFFLKSKGEITYRKLNKDNHEKLLSHSREYGEKNTVKIMKIDESVIDNIINSIIEMDLFDFEITCAEISTPIILDEKEGIFEVPVKIKMKQKFKKK